MKFTILCGNTTQFQILPNIDLKVFTIKMKNGACFCKVGALNVLRLSLERWPSNSYLIVSCMKRADVLGVLSVCGVQTRLLCRIYKLRFRKLYM